MFAPVSLHKPPAFVDERDDHDEGRDNPDPTRRQTIGDGSRNSNRDGRTAESGRADPAGPPSYAPNSVGACPMKLPGLRVIPEQRQIEIEGDDVERAKQHREDLQ